MKSRNILRKHLLKPLIRKSIKDFLCHSTKVFFFWNTYIRICITKNITIPYSTYLYKAFIIIIIIITNIQHFVSNPSVSEVGGFWFRHSKNVIIISRRHVHHITIGTVALFYSGFAWRPRDDNIRSFRSLLSPICR